MKNKTQRIFLPGSEWLYLKLYLGDKSADAILYNQIKQLVHYLKTIEAIDKWFFIRYNDPEFHLRVRFHLVDPYLSNIVLQSINEFFLQKVNLHIIWNIQLETYKREIERYNDILIEDVESIFCINSECILDLLPLIKPFGYDFRWQIGMYMIDKYISSVGISISDRILMFKELSSMFKLEFGFNEFNSKQLNEKFRKYKNDIFHLLDKKENNEYVDCKRVVDLYSLIGTLYMYKIIGVSNSYNLDYRRVVNSVIHMFMNRLLPNNNRFYELFVYDFLYRYYVSCYSRNK